MAPKRIQVQLRDSSLEQVEKLAEQMNISLSKATAFLVDEALAHRQNHPTTQSPMTAEVVMTNSRKLPETELDDEDLKLLKKIKLLKALDL